MVFNQKAAQNRPFALINSLKILKFFLMIVFASVHLGCTAKEKNLGGFQIYSDIQYKSHLTFAFERLQPRLSALLDIALGGWNNALGAHHLRSSSDLNRADVIIRHESTSEVEYNPAHVDLLGCFNGYKNWSDCRINLRIPEKIESLSEMKKVAHLFRQGPLDALLHSRREYTDVSEYLVEKLVVLSLTHEIGHTLGLAHTNDPACMMNHAPRGELGFCPAEIKAAQLLIARSIHFDSLAFEP